MKKSTHSIVYISIFILIALIYTLFIYWTPLVLDNLLFERRYLDANNGDPTFSLKALIDYAAYMRFVDNMRLGNILAPITSLMMPHWLFAVITGLVTAGFMAFAAALCRHGYPDHRAICLALVWLASTIFLPWRDNILVNDYALNYVYAAFVALGFIMLLMPVLEKRECSWGRFVMILIGAVLTGFWHEGFALPLACGICLWILRRRLRTDWRLYVALIVLIAVTLAVFICPGMLFRTHVQIGLNHLSFLQLSLTLLTSITTFVVLAAMCIIRSWRPLVRRLLADPIFIVMLGATFAGCVLAVSVSGQVRIGFAPILFSIICLGRMAMPIIEILPSKATAWISIACFTLLLAHAATTLPWMIRIERQYEKIITEINRGDKSTIFYDIILPESVPAYTLHFPASTTWLDDYFYYILECRLQRDVAIVVPPALNTDIKANPGVPVGDVFRIGNALYAPTDISVLPHQLFRTTVRLNDGSVSSATLTFAGRFTDAAGNEFFYIKPYKIAAADVAEISF